MRSRALARSERKYSGDMPVGGKVLVMDDHQNILDILEEFLGLMGFEVEKALDGETGLRKYASSLRQNRPYDAVITDIMVPDGMDGIEMSERILEMDPKAKIIVTSGHCDQPAMSRWRDFGFMGALPKPYSMDEIMLILRRALKGSGKTDGL